jgi:endo-1,4-beta-D-glucanase Y
LAVTADIWRLEVAQLENGEDLLLPWPLPADERTGPLPVNPSYFSPGHYHLFAEETGEEQWQRLASATYAQLERITTRLGSRRGAGLVPDWCEVSVDGVFGVATERGTASSWDAFRIWWRVRLDESLSGRAEATAFLREGLAPLLREWWRRNDGRVPMELTYSGAIRKSYESPAALGLYAWSLDGLAPEVARRLRERLRTYWSAADRCYQPVDDYYVNSWAWWGEARGRRRFPFAAADPVGRIEP